MSEVDPEGLISFSTVAVLPLSELLNNHTYLEESYYKICNATSLLQATFGNLQEMPAVLHSTNR